VFIHAEKSAADISVAPTNQIADDAEVSHAPDHPDKILKRLRVCRQQLLKQ